MEDDGAEVRVDVWLWAVRLFPTRSAATDACTSGRVRIAGDAVKPARRVVAGDVVVARRADRTGTYRVLRTLTKRVGAPVAVECYEVVAEELHRSPRPPDGAAWGERSRGTGRPTKKERRQIERFRRP
jgi:ribosome-associated heat shock protein Hsp15